MGRSVDVESVERAWDLVGGRAPMACFADRAIGRAGLLRVHAERTTLARLASTRACELPGRARRTCIKTGAARDWVRFTRGARLARSIT